MIHAFKDSSYIPFKGESFQSKTLTKVEIVHMVHIKIKDLIIPLDMKMTHVDNEES